MCLVHAYHGAARQRSLEPRRCDAPRLSSSSLVRLDQVQTPSRTQSPTSRGKNPETERSRFRSPRQPVLVLVSGNKILSSLSDCYHHRWLENAGGSDSPRCCGTGDGVPSKVGWAPFHGSQQLMLDQGLRRDATRAALHALADGAV